MVQYPAGAKQLPAVFSLRAGKIKKKRRHLIMFDKETDCNNDGTDALCIVKKGLSFTLRVNWKNMGIMAYSQFPDGLENAEYQVIVQEPDAEDGRYTFSCYYIPDASGSELFRVFKGSGTAEDGYIGLAEAILEIINDYAEVLYKCTLDVINEHGI